MSKETAYGIELRRILLQIAAALDVKQSIRIDVEEFTLSVSVEIEVFADDYGKICGTGGVMINALKKFVELAGERNGRESRLVLNKPKPGPIGPRPKFREATNWNSEPIRLLCKQASKLLISVPFEVVAHDKSETTTLEILAETNGAEFDRSAPQIRGTIAPIFHAIGKVMGRNEVVVNVGGKS